MMTLEELRKHDEYTSVIDWEMTPEEAVTLYLEWGNNWVNGKRRIRSPKDVSFYFIVGYFTSCLCGPICSAPK